MKSLQEIADELYELVKHYTVNLHMEVHEASRLADIADEIADWADRLEDDMK
jgi:hypothetical protein